MGHGKLDLTNPNEQYPDFLRKAKARQDADNNHSKPIVFDMSQPDSVKKIEALVVANKPELIDNYGEQYAELLLSKNAHLYRAQYDVQVASIRDLLEDHYGGRKTWQIGSWAYFPWNNQLVHLLSRQDFEDLRTIRNRELITHEEQKKLYDSNVAVFGMSVGSASALAMAISGIGRNIKLVDGAVISGSNLNRILTGVTSVGVGKATVIGRQIYEMNPYSNVEYYDKADKTNIAAIFDDAFKIGLAVDEIDDLEMKVRIRYEARQRRVPVIMATELGDTVILDIERYDQEPERPLLHDLVPGIEAMLDAPLENYREWTKRAVEIIGTKNMTIKMQKSLMKIGSTIVTHPQLGSTVMMTGGALAFAAKSILRGDPIKSGRYVISLEHMLLEDHQTMRYRREHRKHSKAFDRAITSM